MTKEEKLILIQANITQAQIEAMGMVADNQLANLRGDNPPWLSYDFNEVIEKYGIHSNAIVSYLGE